VNGTVMPTIACQPLYKNNIKGLADIPKIKKDIRVSKYVIAISK
jgi:hypothetical protein